MKLAGASDIHIKEFGSYSAYRQISESGLTKELDNILKGADFLAQTIEETRPDLFFIAGDLFDNPTALTCREIYTGTRFIKKINKACIARGIPLYLMPGNHDMLNREHHHLWMFQDIPNIHIVNKVTHYKEVTFIPHMYDVGEFLDAIAKTENNIIVAHQDFSGGTYDSGMASRSDLDVRKFKDKVFLAGDLHIPQSFKNVHYCGSLVQNKFQQSSLANVGGALIYDSESETPITRIPNMFSSHYVKVRSLAALKKLPDNVVVSFSGELDKEQMEEQIKEVYPNLEFQYIKSLSSKPEVPTEYTGLEEISPTKMLEATVESERPEALQQLRQIIS